MYELKPLHIQVHRDGDIDNTLLVGGMGQMIDYGRGGGTSARIGLKLVSLPGIPCAAPAGGRQFRIASASGKCVGVVSPETF